MDNIKHLTQTEATNLDQDLFNEYQFSLDQLVELAGLSVAHVIAKEYPPAKYSKPVIVCGHGNNGADGLACARHLKLFGYSPTVINLKLGKAPLCSNLLVQCSKFGIDVVSNPHLTNSLEALGDILVDSLFGFSYKPPCRSADYAQLIKQIHLASKQIPLISVDVPSGWDVETGPQLIEESQAEVEESLRIPALEPECLISLTAPKLCARRFKGKFHYLGGRFCPKEIQDKYVLNLPSYHGSEAIVRLS